jgi:5'-methylthioadenosine phosphorylase
MLMGDGMAEIGIIGGTGVYDPKLLENTRKVKVDTPYGWPSDEITLGELAKRKVAFLNRHGPRHSIPPHIVNSRANIWALKSLGVTRIFAPGAVGSLKDGYDPRDIVISDQFIDFTKRREGTYYENGKVYHISVADPFCSEMRSVLIDCGKRMGMPIKDGGTYVCIEGPRFSTKAESRMFRDFGDIIGMTLVPECQLAREQEICYAAINTVTDYDVWKEKPVSIEEILRVMEDGVVNVRRLLMEAIMALPNERSCPCKTALRDAGV